MQNTYALFMISSVVPGVWQLGDPALVYMQMTYSSLLQNLTFLHHLWGRNQRHRNRRRPLAVGS